ncbi:putative enzyme involved in biosynthesis of extracellular polysaccharides [Vibrio nigripulchritudo MADA3029]|uniref:Putative enzyme involved in biosynthesis of extracellular polysaccharides n=1 Tax=Vibrio nigripulchritudo TaxID=28173 RepID=U4KBQ4_9VIBR|nr:antibiotic biosynthesis monooxygenase [Vibrio nigripulchritudo]CCN46662.1 putative enzyme involved in biosynthesis of extracellular polysaccharides [Vibrio nigripulchritudo MADA3020]CCN54561.1 putative enzyme involved in biosynthesis of extracellular polysaccharides [Vibrio nigripulchritudo MADA3021]CCN59521.1 putative enzyme involved in biosynthesis of extracellular polysaccharides [Vibrio nigripulchritudo MADA3029]CCN82375.1 putative enzyme involved in biosynthesis of extracellular polysac
MIAVIFEVEPKVSGTDEYFDIAGQLKEELVTIDGFISVERFQSLVSPNKFLSLSFWRDEQAVKRWRTQVSHRVAQEKGRTELFSQYRLRVADVIRDYGLNQREQVPADNLDSHN